MECDLAHLQTLHDFDRWKAEGRLLAYKPLGWDQVFGDFKDPDGAYTAMAIISFSSVVNVNLIPEAEAPRGPLDFLDPKQCGASSDSGQTLLELAALEGNAARPLGGAL